MAKHVKRSVIPIYLVGVVWLVFGLGLRLYQPVDYILCALVSVAAFVVGKAIFPDKSYQIAGGEDEEEKKRLADYFIHDYFEIRDNTYERCRR